MSLEQFANSVQSTGFSTALKSASWVVPTLQSVHIIMVGVVFISILMISLRLLGWARVDQPVLQVWNRFAPFFWVGLVVMAVSGALLTIAETVREFMTLSFRLKMGLLVICVVSAAAFGRSARGVAHAAANGAEPAVPGRVRVAAGATLVLWIVIIFLGRAIAYDDSIWGSWSPMKSLGGASTL